MENITMKSKEISVKEDYIPWYSYSIKMNKTIHDDGEIIYSVEVYNDFTEDSKCGYDMRCKVYFDNKKSAKDFYKNIKEGAIDDVKNNIRMNGGDSNKSKEWVREHFYKTLIDIN